MDSTLQILKKQFTINPKDADFRCRLKASSLINYYIEAAWNHAEALNLGFSHLTPLGLAWVLTRLKFIIHSVPTWPGELQLETWPKGMDRIQYIRDAEIKDGNNTAVASITSTWMIIDAKSKRPKVHLKDEELLYKLKDKHAVNETIPALSFSGEPESVTTYIVRYSDVDMNHHLTTLRYLEFMFDTYTEAFILKNQPKEITVNFMREVMFGSRLEMKRFISDNYHGFELLNTDTGAVSFRGEIVY
ncbi:acyl-[acyl-carrier-protein] thioesterase [Saccharicrinis sp. FJH54]|uniref:acyl-[acyl-carrier-protein] thioesterase n=1 Tax=Saccharicrinis sp. FJH54 TaxID=3344665 RepID=UPI0035D478D6